MRVTQRDIQTPAGRRVRLLLPEDAPQILIYMHGHSEEASACAAAPWEAPACIGSGVWSSPSGAGMPPGSASQAPVKIRRSPGSGRTSARQKKPAFDKLDLQSIPKHGRLVLVENSKV